VPEIPLRAIGLAWYRPDDWPALRKLFADGDKLPATHEKWLQQAEAVEQRLKGSGIIVERVYIDPDGFARWCAARGMDIDADARKRFASEAVARKYRNQSRDHAALRRLRAGAVMRRSFARRRARPSCAWASRTRAPLCASRAFSLPPRTDKYPDEARAD